MSLLVRTWNVFHGNTSPPERAGHLEEIVRLATEDEPDVVCLQEVPVWALRHLAEWSGMQSFGAVAARPRLGSAELGHLITELNYGLFRSAFTGQAGVVSSIEKETFPPSITRFFTKPRSTMLLRRFCSFMYVAGSRAAIRDMSKIVLNALTGLISAVTCLPVVSYGLGPSLSFLSVYGWGCTASAMLRRPDDPELSARATI